MANEKGDNIDFLEDSWKRDSEKLATLMAEAKEFISSCDDNLNKRTSIEEPEQLSEAVKLEKRVRDEFWSKIVMPPNLYPIHPQKRMKVENSVSKVVEEKSSPISESKCEDNEEEVCVLSPIEWNMLHSKHKRHGAKTLTKKVETNPEKWCFREFPTECSNVVRILSLMRYY